MNIKGLSKGAVLAALYNAARPQGIGVFQYSDTPMIPEEAQHFIDEHGLKWDYLHGRVLKVDLTGDELFTGLYNRDNGPGAAEHALRALTPNHNGEQ